MAFYGFFCEGKKPWWASALKPRKKCFKCFLLEKKKSPNSFPKEGWKKMDSVVDECWWRQGRGRSWPQRRRRRTTPCSHFFVKFAIHILFPKVNRKIKARSSMNGAWSLSNYYNYEYNYCHLRTCKCKHSIVSGIYTGWASSAIDKVNKCVSILLYTHLLAAAAGSRPLTIFSYMFNQLLPLLGKILRGGRAQAVLRLGKNKAAVNEPAEWSIYCKYAS